MFTHFTRYALPMNQQIYSPSVEYIPKWEHKFQRKLIFPLFYLRERTKKSFDRLTFISYAHKYNKFIQFSLLGPRTWKICSTNLRVQKKNLSLGPSYNFQSYFSMLRLVNRNGSLFSDLRSRNNTRNNGSSYETVNEELTVNHTARSQSFKELFFHLQLVGVFHRLFCAQC